MWKPALMMCTRKFAGGFSPFKNLGFLGGGGRGTGREGMGGISGCAGKLRGIFFGLGEDAGSGCACGIRGIFFGNGDGLTAALGPGWAAGRDTPRPEPNPSPLLPAPLAATS